MFKKLCRSIVHKAKVLLRVFFSRNVLLTVFPSLGFAYFKWKYTKLFERIASRGGKFVLEIAYGGLGDHLIYSSLPAILFSKFGVETYISATTPFRSEDIRDLVWRNNAHVHFSQEKGSILRIPRLKSCANYNDVLFKMFPVADTPSITVPYIPRFRPDLQGKIVCDLTYGPSGILNGYADENFRSAVFQYLFQRKMISQTLFIEPQDGYPDKSILSFIREHEGQIQILRVKGLFELADVLYSADERILLYSGSASLSAALGKHSTVLCRTMANRYFQYPVNTYIFI